MPLGLLAKRAAYAGFACAGRRSVATSFIKNAYAWRGIKPLALRHASTGQTGSYSEQVQSAFARLRAARFRLIVGGVVTGILGVVGAVWVYISETPQAVENVTALLASRSFQRGGSFDARKGSEFQLGGTPHATHCAPCPHCWHACSRCACHLAPSAASVCLRDLWLAGLP